MKISRKSLIKRLKRLRRILQRQPGMPRLMLPVVVAASMVGGVAYSHTASTTPQPVVKHPAGVERPATKPAAKTAPTTKPSAGAAPAKTSPSSTSSTPAPTATHPTPAAPVVPAPTSKVSHLSPSSGSGSSSSGGGSSGSSGASGSGGSGTSSPPPTSYTSTNWSGYMLVGSGYTSVSGAWTTPTPTGNGFTTSGDVSWIGIGGVTSNDLIQVGTQNTVSASGQVTTDAFYEILPAVAQTIPGVAVHPGDSITAEVKQISAGEWSISLSDLTDSQSYTTTLAYNSSGSSAEWIEEDPSYSNGQQVPFDNFGTTDFSNSSAVNAGSSVTLTNASSITMVAGGSPISTPSAVSGGTSFIVTRS